MLTMRKISVVVGDEANANRVAAYVLERPDGPDRTRSAWLGSEVALGAIGAEPQAEVRREQLVRALQGQHTASGEQVRKPGKLKREDEADAALAIATIDLTFSAPKSVSVLWSQETPDRRLLIEEAMVAAARSMLEHLTRTRPIVYRRVDGRRLGEPAQGPAAAGALHITARRAAGDPVPSPQLHVHSILIGVERRDGQLVAPNSAALLKGGTPVEGGAVARAALADGLVEIGYELEPETGDSGRYFEVRGLPGRLVERASGRAREVRAAIDAHERERGAPLRGGALAVAALETRQAKEPRLSVAEMARVWRAWAQEVGFGPGQVAGLRNGGGYPGALAKRRQSAREALQRKLEPLGPTFPDDLARTVAYEAAPGRLDLDEVGVLLDSMWRSGALTLVGDGRATVQGSALLRREVLRAATEWTVLERGPEAPAEALPAFVSARRELGWEVIASAGGAAGARLLGAELDCPWSAAERLVSRLEQGRLRFAEPTVLVVAEPERIGLGIWAEIARAHETHGTQVIALRDGERFAEVDAVTAFREILEVTPDRGG